jgi:hypothetical protein
MSCGHAKVPSVVNHANGEKLCSWCEVIRLRVELLRAHEHANQLEMECGKLQLQLATARGLPIDVSNAMGGMIRA